MGGLKMDLVKVRGGGPAERAKEATARLVEEAGYDLLEIVYEREGSNMNLVYLIDKRGGISLDDCEAVTDIVNPILDEVDISQRAYNLIVSSPGVDRPFEHERDFLRYLDREVEISLYQKLPDGRKRFSAWLRDYKDGVLTLTETEDGDLETETMTIAADEYSLVKQALRF